MLKPQRQAYLSFRTLTLNKMQTLRDQPVLVEHATDKTPSNFADSLITCEHNFLATGHWGGITKNLPLLHVRNSCSVISSVLWNTIHNVPKPKSFRLLWQSTTILNSYRLFLLILFVVLLPRHNKYSSGYGFIPLSPCHGLLIPLNYFFFQHDGNLSVSYLAINLKANS